MKYELVKRRPEQRGEMKKTKTEKKFIKREKRLIIFRNYCFGGCVGQKNRKKDKNKGKVKMESKKTKKKKKKNGVKGKTKRKNRTARKLSTNSSF